MQYLTVPDSIESIGNDFIHSTKLIEFKLPFSCKELASDQSFDVQYTLERIIVSPNHERYTSYNDALYTKDMKTLVYYPSGKKSKVVLIPQGTETINIAAFAFSNTIETIILPPSVKSICNYFCFKIANLKRVIIVSCNDKINATFTGSSNFFDSGIAKSQIEWINQSYYYYLDNEAHLDIRLNPQCMNNQYPIEVNNTGFSGDNSIESISFEHGITSIKGACFSECTKIKKIAFPSTLQYIDRSSFSNCYIHKRYSAVFYPKSILPILKGVFSRYTLGLSNITCKHSNSLSSLFFVLLIRN